MAAAHEGRRHCDGNDGCSTKREALVRVHVDIPIDGVGNLGRLSGVRVRCAVLGNVEWVVESCVSAGNSLVALMSLKVKAESSSKFCGGCTCACGCAGSCLP